LQFPVSSATNPEPAIEPATTANATHHQKTSTPEKKKTAPSQNPLKKRLTIKKIQPHSRGLHARAARHHSILLGAAIILWPYLAKTKHP